VDNRDKKLNRKVGKKRIPEQAQGLASSFSQKNLMLILAALIVIIIGHVALGMGSITFAPLCLLVGYCVLVPLAIIL